MMASIIESGLCLPHELNFVWLTHNKQILIQTQNEIIEAIGNNVTSVYKIEQGIEDFGGRILLLNVQKGVSAKAKKWLKKWSQYQAKLERKNIFIIDEADEGMSGKNMGSIKEILQPELELGFTASFKKKDDEYEFKKVKHQDVIEAEMLVGSIYYQASDEINKLEITKRAIAQREYLEQRAESLKYYDPERYFVPKALIQAPASSCEAMAKELQAILNLSDKDFKKYIIVHTQNSRGLDEVEEMSEVKYIIGDLMVERGWNCPEAYVLLSTKESISQAKGIQLLGRVIRLPQAKRFEDDFNIFNSGYVYISGRHSIEKSCQNFTNEIPAVPPPKEVEQVEKRNDIVVPEMITFKNELNKDIEDRDLIPFSERICDAIDEIKYKCQENIPKINKGELDLKDSSVSPKKEMVDAEWSFEQVKTLLINALSKYFPKNYANVVVTKYQIKMQSKGGLVKVGPFCKELSKMIKESSVIRRMSEELDYICQPYKWAPHKLVVTKPLPLKFQRALYHKMQLNSEEKSFAQYLDKAAERLGLFWVRNDPSNVKIFKGHAPDFIIFNETRYAFIEFKGKHLLHSQDSIRKNEAGQAASAYFMVYKDSDTEKFYLKGRVGEADEIFDDSLIRAEIV